MNSIRRDDPDRRLGLAAWRWKSGLPLCMLMLSLVQRASSQNVQIEWTKRYGGSAGDFLSVARQSAGTGYILGGTTESGVSGNKTSGRYGGRDWWVVSLNSAGDAEWDRTFGGATHPVFAQIQAYDYLDAISPVSDGGFLLVGSSYTSTGGTKTVSGNGGWDIYAVRINAQGEQLWDRVYGATENESASGLAATSDGGYVIVGSTSPTTGSLPADVWVVRIDSAGNRLWDRTFGGEGFDQGIAVVQTSDGGYWIAANSASAPSGNKTSPYYGGGFISDATGDFWLLRLDAQGNKLAERAFGGMYDEEVFALVLTADDGALVVGESYSPESGNKSSTNAGYTDAWMVRVNSTGDKLWEKSLGGTWYDGLRFAARMGDDGFILAGHTNGAPWLVRLNQRGRVLWDEQPALAGDGGIAALDRTRDGGFLVGSTTGGGFGSSDFVVTKLAPELPRLSVLQGPQDVRSEGFRFQVLSPPGMFVVECSTNASNWAPLRTNLSTGVTFPITDSSATNAVQKFYRVRRM